MIRCFLNLNKVRLLQDSWMGQTSVERLHGRLDVLHTSFPPSPSWIQDGCGGNDVIQNLGRVFRPLLRRRRKMAALPLPVAILDDLICGSEMRSSKMATGSGRAAILRRRRNRDRKTRPILLASQITSLMIFYSSVYSGADQRIKQSSASMAFVRGIHRWPVNSLHKWSVTLKMFPSYDVIMIMEIIILCKTPSTVGVQSTRSFFCNSCLTNSSWQGCIHAYNIYPPEPTKYYLCFTCFNRLCKT